MTQMENPQPTAPQFSSILFALLQCFPALLQAQAYIPTLNENATWDVQCLVAYGMPPECDYLTGSDTYSIIGDTTILGVEYKIVSGLLYNPGFGKRYVREDTLTRKVYSVLDPYGGPGETVLYDYSAMVGDSIFWYDYFVSTIYSIDIITLANGEVRRRFNLESGFIYIEGIGGSTGISFPFITGPGVEQALTCYKLNGVPQIDSDELYTISCPINMGIEPVGSVVPSIVSPNPSSGHITINRKTDLIQTFQFVDMSGRSIYTQTLSNQIDQIYLSLFQAGFYLYMLNEKDLGKLILFR